MVVYKVRWRRCSATAQRCFPRFHQIQFKRLVIFLTQGTHDDPSRSSRMRVRILKYHTGWTTATMPRAHDARYIDYIIRCPGGAKIKLLKTSAWLLLNCRFINVSHGQHGRGTQSRSKLGLAFLLNCSPSCFRSRSRCHRQFISPSMTNACAPYELI
jgi:hypothetical protein